MSAVPTITRTLDEVGEDIAEWVDRISYHPATPDTAILHDSLRTAAATAGRHIIRALPRSRERSLALTNLEQSLMWANKAVAMLSPVDTETPAVARVLPPDPPADQ